MEKSEVISTLNDLLKTTRDSEIGFRASAEQVGSDALMSVFQIAARDCGSDVGELSSHIRALDGVPSNSGTLSGSLHRAWATLRSSVAAMDDYTVLKECERAQGAVRCAYESALKKDLPTDMRTVIERQYQGVKENGDSVRDLRISRRAAH
jgi:uncharacterized protein (TIGR02284 family)